MLWRSAEGYVRHWFALIGAALVVVLRPSIKLLLGDTWVYSRFVVFPYEFELKSAFILVITMLLVFYMLLKWMDYRIRALSRG